MYDENQIVTIRWSNSNRKWFESKGYVYPGHRSTLDVPAKHISPRSAAKIKVTCDYCGNEYITQFDVLQKGRLTLPKDSCPHCAAKKANDVSKKKRARKNFSKLHAICKENGYTLITGEDEFTDVKMNIKFECPEHGVQTMILDNFIRGHRCILCSYKNKARLDTRYVDEYIKSVNGNLWLNKDEYTNSTDRNLLIRCKCENTYTTSFANFLRKNITRCPTCTQKESSGELKIRKYLEDKNIEFEQEKRFTDCRDVKPLPFDFYLHSQNMCIEFDGQQHYENIFGEESFRRCQRHDKIKNEYCLLHGITMLRIPYWEGNNINDILDKNINI